MANGGFQVGVLGLGLPSPWSFSAQDRGFLRAFALQLAHVLHRARQLDVDEAARVLGDRAASRFALLHGFTEALRALSALIIGLTVQQEGLPSPLDHVSMP